MHTLLVVSNAHAAHSQQCLIFLSSSGCDTRHFRYRGKKVNPHYILPWPRLPTPPLSFFILLWAYWLFLWVSLDGHPGLVGLHELVSMARDGENVADAITQSETQTSCPECCWKTKLSRDLKHAHEGRILQFTILKSEPCMSWWRPYKQEMQSSSQKLLLLWK